MDALTSVALSKRITQEDLGSQAPYDLAVYLGLHITAGHILLPILILTFVFSKNVSRHPTLINFLITLVLSSVNACILLYAGQESGPEPSRVLCTIQTAGVYGTPPMWSVAVLVLVWSIWSRFARYPAKSEPSHAWLVIMLAAPYVTFLIGAGFGAYVAVTHPAQTTRERKFLYCSVAYSPFSDTIAVTTALICLVTTGLQVHLAVMLYRNWRVLRRAGQTSGIDMKFVVRLFVFGLYVFAGLIICLVTIPNAKSLFPDLYTASAGLTAFLVYGTQADVLRVWCFWRTKTQPKEEIKSNTGWSVDFDLDDVQALKPKLKLEMPPSPKSVHARRWKQGEAFSIYHTPSLTTGTTSSTPSDVAGGKQSA